MGEPVTIHRSVEEELITRVARGDEATIREFYAAYADRVLAFVYQRTQQWEDAEEITLEVFLAAIRASGSFQGRSHLFTWLCGIAKNQISLYYRQHTRARDIPSAQLELREPGEMEGLMETMQEMPSLDEIVRREETQQMVRWILGRLPEPEREVLLLRYVDEFSVAEVAQMMTFSVKKTERLLTQARKSFVQAREAYAAGESEDLLAG